jgi:hypothetical protein
MSECCYAQCLPSVIYAESRYAECRYTECRYADCRGTHKRKILNPHGGQIAQQHGRGEA